MKIGNVLLTELAATSSPLDHEWRVADMLESFGFELWQSPAGDANIFPDIGASIELPSGLLNVHIEIKQSKNDQMGSIRNWTFDGSRFDATHYENPNTRIIIDMLNDDPVAVGNAKRMMKELNKFFDKKIHLLSSGCLSVVTDKKERYERLKAFNESKSVNTMILSRTGPDVGTMIIKHYKKKYKPKGDGDNVLAMVMGNEMFLVKTHKVPSSDMLRELADALELEDEIPFIPSSFEGGIEVRVQPRHMSKKGASPVTLDTMANLRGKGLKTLKGAVVF